MLAGVDSRFAAMVQHQASRIDAIESADGVLVDAAMIGLTAGVATPAVLGRRAAIEVGEAAASKATASECAKLDCLIFGPLGRTHLKMARQHALIVVADAFDHVKSLKSYADDVNSGKLSKVDAANKANVPSNLTPSCNPCNLSKGAKTLSPTSGSGQWSAPNGYYPF